MSDAPSTPKDASADTPADMNPRGLWPLWFKQQEWRQKLERKATHKALDIPDDDMNITQTKVGIGTAGAIGIAAAVGLPSMAAVGIMAWALLKEKSAPTAPTPTTPSVEVPDTEYEVRFFDKDGKPISVKPISELKKEAHQ